MVWCISQGQLVMNGDSSFKYRNRNVQFWSREVDLVLKVGCLCDVGRMRLASADGHVGSGYARSSQP
jgi:hypothetical protein